MRNERIDVLVVKQGLAESREKARALVLAGRILSGDRLFDKPGQKIPEDTPLRVRGETDPYVSRAARKLIGALDAFQIGLAGAVCLDVGASTGGFTQVCLERGASKVYAVDVGHNQLHWKIRNDARVVSLEGVNMRSPAGDLIPEKANFICIDTSFISLKLILPGASRFLAPGGEMVALIKPQHEVGREDVGRGGVVRDPALHERATGEVAAFAQSIGFEVMGLVESPLVGTAGNKEFLIHLKRSGAEP